VSSTSTITTGIISRREEDCTTSNCNPNSNSNECSEEGKDNEELIEEFLPDEKAEESSKTHTQKASSKSTSKSTSKSKSKSTSMRQSSVLKSFVRSGDNSGLYITSRRVDAVLAGLGMSLALASLKIVDKTFLHSHEHEHEHEHSHLHGVNLHAGFLISSAANFFFNRKPPGLKAYMSSSIVAIIVGTIVHLFKQTLGDMCDALCIFCMMTYWKLTGNNFGAAASISIYIATRETNQNFPFLYLLSPYLLGHLILYIMAYSLSIVRNKVRIKLIKREFFFNVEISTYYLKTLHPHPYPHPYPYPHMKEKRLRLLFNRMDLSGDGTLDKEEFQSALNTAFNEDVSLDEAKEILDSFDRTGDGTVDFDDFKLAIDDIMRR